MAIYHLNFRRCSKSKGQSATAKYDYIHREDKYNKNRDDLVYSQSGNIPDFAKDNPKEFWKNADEFERSNARVCTEIEFALPRELNLEQQQELIDEFIKNNLDNEHHKLAYSYAIHNDKDNHNPHCHLIFSERNIDGISRSPEQFFKRANSKDPSLGGAKKSEYATKRDFVQEVRTSWRKSANEHLQKAGLNIAIDERTLQAQGIDRESPRRLNRIEFKHMKELEALNAECEKEIIKADIAQVDLKIDFHKEHEEYLRKDYRVNQTVNIEPFQNKPLFGLFMNKNQKSTLKYGREEEKRIKSEFEKNRATLREHEQRKTTLSKFLEEINHKIEVITKTLKGLGSVKAPQRELLTFEKQEQDRKIKADLEMKSRFEQALKNPLIKSKSKTNSNSKGMKI